MASLVRIGVSRVANTPMLKKILPAKAEITFVRTITSKLVRDQDTDRPVKPAPFDYNSKAYNIFKYWSDRTTSRLDENSKVIVVEGPVASGKTQFAKALAEELDMMYYPEANANMVYINDYGYDLRQLDPQLPESCRSFDIKDFLQNPKHQNTAKFQFLQYEIKYSQYVDALAHLLNSGQGVVLDRCAYSDFVFVEAMYSQGLLSKGAYKGYYDVRDNTISELVRPHLVIYLDVPVSKVQDNISKRGYSCEKGSSVLTPKYLGAMEKIYKQKYLKEMSRHAELLIYDWSDGGEVEVVVEDIERIDFDHYDIQDIKMKDWKMDTEEDWGVLRNKYTDQKDALMAFFNVPLFEIPEMVVEAEDEKLKDEVFSEAPGQRYDVGFNADMGDTGVLFKNKGKRRNTLPKIERELH